jgi:2-amino-4-hydroxy-6-hydroxymethyldihydropteridine diphosphokinase
MRTSYIIALGSNRCHGRYGPPARVIAAALTCLDLKILAASPIVSSLPLGPSRRAFANAAALVESDLPPDALLLHLKQIERAFGRRGGIKWGPRVLDLDIILWSGGIWTSPGLAIPHPGYRTRRFVLDPIVTLAPDLRDPATGLSMRHLQSRLDRAVPRN